MKLKELLSIADREKIFEIAYGDMQNDILLEKNKIDKGKFKSVYFGAIDIIIAMRNKKTAERNLVIAKVKDFDGNERFDVFLMKTNDNEHYAIYLSSWSEYCSCEIHDESIKRYGAEIVAQAIINDMTFFGFTKVQHDRKRQSMKRRLIKAADVDPSKYIPAEQVFAELNEKFGLPPREEKTKEQILAEREEMENIMRNNFAELDLLGVPYKNE